MSLSLLLQQCLACLVRLAWIVCVMGDKCCLHDLFNIALRILHVFSLRLCSASI